MTRMICVNAFIQKVHTKMLGVYFCLGQDSFCVFAYTPWYDLPLRTNYTKSRTDLVCLCTNYTHIGFRILSTLKGKDKHEKIY